MEDKVAIKNLGEVLGEDEALWYKARVKTEVLVGKIAVLTHAEYRSSPNSNYYILHWTNEATGAQVTSTCGGTILMKKISALSNREAFPVRCRVVKSGNSFDIVDPDTKEA